MPKKFSDTDKGNWLKLYESGKTEKWIARERAKCDPRTVKKGIEEARRKQDARVARADLIKEALRKHQDSLLEELDSIASDLTVPTEDFVVLPWNDPILTQPETATEWQTDDVSGPHRVSRSQGEAVRRLLKQHLKNDRLWKVLVQWEKAYTAHLGTRVALQRRTVAILQEKTGLKLTDKNDIPRPFLYSYTTGVLFFKAVQHAFGATSFDEGEIVANTNTRDVRYRGSILAETSGNEEKIRADLLEALRELKTSPEVTLVVDTHRTLEEIEMRARQIVEQIKLLGFIPGQCEICRRLGI